MNHVLKNVEIFSLQYNEYGETIVAEKVTFGKRIHMNLAFSFLAATLIEIMFSNLQKQKLSLLSERLNCQVNSFFSQHNKVMLNVMYLIVTYLLSHCGEFQLLCNNIHSQQL